MPNSEDAGTAITARDVRLWKRGKADEETRRRIEEDLKRPDSDVQHYLDWQAGRCPIRPSPKLLQEEIAQKVEAAGGPDAYAELFEGFLKESELPERENPHGLRIFDPDRRGR